MSPDAFRARAAELLAELGATDVGQALAGALAYGRRHSEAERASHRGNLCTCRIGGANVGAPCGECSHPLTWHKPEGGCVGVVVSR